MQEKIYEYRYLHHLMTSATDDRNELMQKCIHFLYTIGIEVAFRKLSSTCFLPGLYIEEGKLLIDREGLRYPGDILHEAGHIAVVSAVDRPDLSNSRILESKQRDAEEMMAIAWSYAAAFHLQIDPHLIFHDFGYKGTGNTLVENFLAGDNFGAPMLHFCGMTDEDAYPEMTCWLRK